MLTPFKKGSCYVEFVDLVQVRSSTELFKHDIVRIFRCLISLTHSLQSEKDVPPTIYFFKKCIPGHSYCKPPAYQFFEPREHCPNQAQNCPVKVVHGQSFCPLFVVLKKCLHESQFPRHSLSYVRREWNKLPQDTTENMQFFQTPPPPAYCNSRLFTFRFFPTPTHLLPSPPIYCHPHPFIATPF